MTKFLLDTGAVDSVASSIKDLSNQAKDIMRKVSKYDVDNEDNFNFSGAKDALSTNVSSAYIKFRLTNQYLKKVVNTHTELQESVNGGGSGGGSGSLYGGRYGGYYGGYGVYGGGGSTPMPEEESVTSPNGTVFTAGTITLEVLKQLLADGLFTDSTIDKLNKIEGKVLVITLSKNDDNYQDKLELAEELSKIYDIDLVINEKEEDDIETSLCIVKNGIVLASTTELTDVEAIKEMFKKAAVDLEDEDLDIESLKEDDDSDDESDKDNEDNSSDTDEETSKQDEEESDRANDQEQQATTLDEETSLEVPSTLQKEELITK